MDFIEVETDQGLLLINIYEIVYISQCGDYTQIKLKGSPITLTVENSIEDIKEQLNQGYDDGYGISFTTN